MTIEDLLKLLENDDVVDASSDLSEFLYSIPEDQVEAVILSHMSQDEVEAITATSQEDEVARNLFKSDDTYKGTRTRSRRSRRKNHRRRSSRRHKSRSRRSSRRHRSRRQSSRK